jgi:hypothetical protein
MSTGKLCVRCGLRPSENWPADTRGELCTDCWEHQCSREWWGVVNAINSARIWERDPGVEPPALIPATAVRCPNNKLTDAPNKGPSPER